MATFWENSCSFGLRYVSWYKYLIVSLVFSHLGFWNGNLFLIAPFPDLCLLVPLYLLLFIAMAAILVMSSRTTADHGHPISSPYEPNGSALLKISGVSLKYFGFSTLSPGSRLKRVEKCNAVLSIKNNIIRSNLNM